jgi:4-hydroxythreonine-4-phosphate dehydrogenase
MNYFVFTCGDINGIGPEITLKAFNRFIKEKNKLIFVCPANVFYNAFAMVQPHCDFRVIKNPLEISPDASVIDVIDFGNPQLKPGKPTKISGETSFAALKIAFEIVMMFEKAALITAPVSKEALKMAGVKYPGHTEMLADWSLADDYAMMFLSGEMKLALATIHIPVKDVAKNIKQEKLVKTLKVISGSLKVDFALKTPKIAVLGLNPHAGENGNIGGEELNEIIPAVKKMKNKNVEGPFVADAFFGMQMYKEYDCVLGMYHDQALIPFKLLNFSSGVNYTAGLPVVRTSPDHGTAYGIAWRNSADETSMVNACSWAKIILHNRNK